MEIGVYSPSGGWGQKARIAAIARHLPLDQVMVYTLEGGRGNAPLDYFGIPWVAVKCESPNCGGVSPQKFATFIADRRPDTLIMDAWPYGTFNREMANYIKSRGSARTFFTCRRNPYIEVPDYPLYPSDFQAIVKFESESPVPGIDLDPILPFDEHEILPRASARAAIGAGERPFVLILPSGYSSPDVVSFARAACEKRGIDHEVWDGYPVMPNLTGPDLVITFAGSVVNELRALGTPYQAVAAHVDSRDQALRANATPASMIAAIDGLEVLDPWVPHYRNNARRAAALLAGNLDWESIDG